MTLVFGDAVMVLATQMASERITMETGLPYAGVMVVCWVAVGAALGDYRANANEVDSWPLSLVGPVAPAVVNASKTWALSAVVMLAVLSTLGAYGIIDANPLVQDLNSDESSPELEIIVALFVIMVSWRGIAARLRWR